MRQDVSIGRSEGARRLHLAWIEIRERRHEPRRRGSSLRDACAVHPRINMGIGLR